MKRRQQDSNLRAALAACAIATRCLANSAMPPCARPGVLLAGTRGAPPRARDPEQGGRRGSRTPKPVKATRFRDGVPRRWQSFQGDPGRLRTCTSPGKSRELCQLSYGVVMWPAGVEPATPRVSGERSTALSYGHVCRSNTTRWAPARERSWARLGSNQHPLVCETSALPLSYSPIAVAVSGRRRLSPGQLRPRQRAPSGICPAAGGDPSGRNPARRIHCSRASSGTRGRTSISTFRAWCPAG